MRGAVFGIACWTCWACTAGSKEPADTRVFVVDRLVSTWPEPPSAVTFRDPAGVAIPALHASSPSLGDMVYADMPEGGSVSVFTNYSSSPTATAWDRWSIAGVMPGDHFVFDGSAPHLPADCTHRSITSFTLDATKTQASWQDPDAGSVDARIVHRSTGCNQFFPPIMCSVTVEVDGSTATSVEAHPVNDPSGTGTDLTSVDLVVCPAEHYDDIRTLLTASFLR